MRFRLLADWLAWQEVLNPRGVDLGLDRVRPVAVRLGLDAPAPRVVTVAGTNGKGSCVAYLEAALMASGRRVGAYTSPHLRRFNETVRIDAREAGDDDIVAAFDRVDAAREDVPLTWFEFRTLAVADLFRRSTLDVAVLEVGLGGRLDAVNLFDADVAVITSIGIDHAEWLGPTRESIAREKAGIFRRGRPAVCAEPDPPATLHDAARDTGAVLHRLGHEFHWRASHDGWTFESAGARVEGLPPPPLPGSCQFRNAAAAIAAVHLLGESPGANALRAALRGARVAGRIEIRPGPVEHVFDVAHNVQAAEALGAVLAARPPAGRTFAVFAMLDDKDVEGVVTALGATVDVWHVAGLEHHPRGASGAHTAARAASALAGISPQVHPDVISAWRGATAEAAAGDRVVAFGSFETVRPVIDLEV